MLALCYTDPVPASENPGWRADALREEAESRARAAGMPPEVLAVIGSASRFYETSVFYRPPRCVPPLISPDLPSDLPLISPTPPCHLPPSQPGLALARRRRCAAGRRCTRHPAVPRGRREPGRSGWIPTGERAQAGPVIR